MTQEQFTIIVPIVGANLAFEDTLASVLRTRPESAQIIGVHRRNYQDPHQLAGEVDFIDAGPQASLIEMWNSALSHARGQWVVWLYPGIELQDCWEAEMAEEFKRPQVGCLVPPLFGTRSSRNPNQRRLACYGLSWNGSRPAEPITSEDDLIGLDNIANSGLVVSDSRLLPSPLMAVFRNSALGWLEPLDSTIPESSLGIEWGLGLAALGFETRTSSSVFATSDFTPELIEYLRAASKPSELAMAFERSINRYFPDQIAKRRRRAVQHVLRHFWQPGGWRYAAETLRADRFVGIDQAYYQRSLIARQRREKLLPWNRVEITNPESTATIKSGSVDRRQQRRAA